MVQGYAEMNKHVRNSEGVGFEPTRAFALPVFKTGAINHSTTPPDPGRFATEQEELAVIVAAGKQIKRSRQPDAPWRHAAVTAAYQAQPDEPQLGAVRVSFALSLRYQRRAERACVVSQRTGNYLA